MFSGGYYICPRNDTELFEQSPLVVKLWLWLLREANHTDRAPLKRGQLVTTISEMQEAMSYSKGWQKIKPTKDEIRTAYETLKGAHSNPTRITTRKTTRGMVITILNYDTIQKISSYASHTVARDETATKPGATPHDTESIIKQGKHKTEKPSGYSDDFESFWRLYPKRVGKDTAWKAWQKNKPPFDDVLKALEWQKQSEQWTKEGGQFIPHASTYLNGGRWKDDDPNELSPEQEQAELDSINSIRRAHCLPPVKNLAEYKAKREESEFKATNERRIEEGRPPFKDIEEYRAMKRREREVVF